MKGKLAPTGLIVLETDESHWLMLITGFLTSIKMSGVIERDDSRVRIKLVVTHIFSPEMIRVNHSTLTKTTLGDDIARGISRSNNFLSEYLDKDAWIFIGYIDGEEKVPILITHYKSINLTIYAQKLVSENKFFPELN
ncbi:MAG: hypothetical protein WCI93_03610 [bacterium]